MYLQARPCPDRNILASRSCNWFVMSCILPSRRPSSSRALASLPSASATKATDFGSRRVVTTVGSARVVETLGPYGTNDVDELGWSTFGPYGTNDVDELGWSAKATVSSGADASSN